MAAALISVSKKYCRCLQRLDSILPQVFLRAVNGASAHSLASADNNAGSTVIADSPSPPIIDTSTASSSSISETTSTSAKIPDKESILGSVVVPLPYFQVPSDAASLGRGSARGLTDAVQAVKAGARAKFDETVEAHIKLSIDPRRSDQMVRGMAELPHGTGRVVRVAVFAEGLEAAAAVKAGADMVGAADLVQHVKDSGGKLEFDKCIATPSMMRSLSQIARILGPRGLMPNPKLGTVTSNVGEAVLAAKRGRVDFRADKNGIVHAGLGKVSFDNSALMENVAAFAAALLSAKPTGVKKSSRYSGYFDTVTLTSTMGQGVRVSIQSVANAADSYVKGSLGK